MPDSSTRVGRGRSAASIAKQRIVTLRIIELPGTSALGAETVTALANAVLKRDAFVENEAFATP